jgi:hypothetical protein
MSNVIKIEKVQRKNLKIKIIFPDGFAKWVNGKVFDAVDFATFPLNNAEIKLWGNGKIQTIYFNPERNTAKDKEPETFKVPQKEFERLQKVLKLALQAFDAATKPPPPEGVMTITPN